MKCFILLVVVAIISLFFLSGCKETYTRVSVSTIPSYHYSHYSWYHDYGFNHYRPPVAIYHNQQPPVVIHNLQPPVVVHNPQPPVIHYNRPSSQTQRRVSPSSQVRSRAQSPSRSAGRTRR